jgi:hypothetical protein
MVFDPSLQQIQDYDLAISFGIPLNLNPYSFRDEWFRMSALGSQLRRRLEVVNGNSSWTLQQLEEAEKPKTVPQSATIAVTPSENTVFVSWNPHGDGGSVITGYRLTLKNTDTNQTITELTPSYNTTSTLLQNLDSGTNYKAYIIVLNAIGNSPENSISFKTLSVITPELDPTIPSTTWVNQSVYGFKLQNDIVSGTIVFTATQSFNPFWFGKTIKSLALLFGSAGQAITGTVQNNLVFNNVGDTQTVNYSIQAGGQLYASIKIFVWESLENPLVFSTQTEIFFDPTTTPITIPDGFHEMPDGSIMADSDMYNFIIESDGLVRMFRLGAVEYTEIKVKPESVQDFINRGVSRLLTAQERAIPYPRLLPPVVVPPIQLSSDNFLPNGNVRVIRVTGILANDYEVTDGVALENLQSYLDSGVFRLLTQAELDYVVPPVVVPPVVVPKEYDVNTYRINQFGGVYNEIIYGIDDNRLLQLEAEFLVTLVGSPTPSDQEVKDFYNYIDIDTSVKFTMVSQRFLAFKIVDGYLQGNIQYVATGSFNPHYNNKIIYSVVQVQDSNGNFILIGNEPKKTIKVNELRFTSSQIDEKININEYVGDIEAVTIQAFVSTKPDLITGEFFTGIISLEVVKDDGKTCPTGYHLGFNGKCVLDGGKETGGSTSILGKVMGVTALLGTLALLGAKRR